MSDYKGFTWAELAPFGVRREGSVAVVPYLTSGGKLWREKCFALGPWDGPRSWWRGEKRPQIPYGLETLAFGGNRIFLTEGESDSWALRVANPGVPVVGLPGASSWQTEWNGILDPFPIIYLSFDGDRAGAALYDRLVDTIPRCRPIQPFVDGDTRETIQRYGVAVFKELVRVADERWKERAKADPLAKTMVVLPDS